jgi:predicted  nucleic acid-binding Zn-ribbon protein
MTGTDEKQSELSEFSDQQTKLTDFNDESEPESELAALEARIDDLEADQEATVDIVEDVLENVDKLTSDTDSAHQPPEHTDVRGYQ